MWRDLKALLRSFLCVTNVSSTEYESVESDDSDEETEETKQGNPYLRSVVVSLPQPYDDRSQIRFLLSE